MARFFSVQMTSGVLSARHRTQLEMLARSLGIGELVVKLQTLHLHLGMETMIARRLMVERQLYYIRTVQSYD